MKLIYYDRSCGNNFGDLLNELIFDHYLPGFFDDCDQIGFIGIGSILGLPFTKVPKRKVVFSSGFAYGSLPRIDDSYEFLCVRGPLTAEALRLPQEMAIADGAYLLRGMVREASAKKYKCSLMLHWSNVGKFRWREICGNAGIHFIDPSEDVSQILRQIGESELVLAEAMHAAIAADALRVPWLPLRCYRGINTFKWRDFTAAMELPYEPVPVWPMYDNNASVRELLRKKTKGVLNIGRMPGSLCFKAYESVRERVLIEKVTERLTRLSGSEGIMSKNSVVDDRFVRLLDRLRAFEATHR